MIDKYSLTCTCAGQGSHKKLQHLHHKACCCSVAYKSCTVTEPLPLSSSLLHIVYSVSSRLVFFTTTDTTCRLWDCYRYPVIINTTRPLLTVSIPHLFYHHQVIILFTTTLQLPSSVVHTYLINQQCTKQSNAFK